MLEQEIISIYKHNCFFCISFIFDTCLSAAFLSLKVYQEIGLVWASTSTHPFSLSQTCQRYENNPPLTSKGPRPIPCVPSASHWQKFSWFLLYTLTLSVDHKEELNWNDPLVELRGQEFIGTSSTAHFCFLSKSWSCFRHFILNLFFLSL